MKNKRNSNSAKGLAIASAVGVAAVSVSLAAAYSSVSKNLVQTGAGASENLWSYSAPKSSQGTVSPDIPVQGSAAEVAKSTQSSKSSKSSKSSSADAEPVNRPVVIKATNIMPVEGEIDKPFSDGELVKSETLGVWKTHDGCDILCDLGTDVRSMSEGVVREIKDDPLMGVYVVVEQSNGLEVHYCGLAKELNVKAGQEISQGETIGKTSDTNQSEILQKPHLHLGVKQNGKWIDPLSVVD